MDQKLDQKSKEISLTVRDWEDENKTQPDVKVACVGVDKTVEFIKSLLNNKYEVIVRNDDMNIYIVEANPDRNEQFGNTIAVWMYPENWENYLFLLQSEEEITLESEQEETLDNEQHIPDGIKKEEE